MSKPVTRAVGQQVRRGSARAAAVVQHMPPRHVAQRRQVPRLSFIEYARGIDADDQRVAVTREIAGFVPLVFEFEFLIEIHGIRFVG